MPVRELMHRTMQRRRSTYAAWRCVWTMVLAHVSLRPGESPLLTAFGMMRAEDLPAGMRNRTWVEPPLVIRSADGSVHPEYAAIKLAIGFPP